MKNLALAALSVVLSVLAVTSTFAGPDPQIISVTYAPASDPTNSQVFDGATLHYGVQYVLTVTANSDTTNVIFGCPDSPYPVACKNDESVPYTRPNFVPQGVGSHFMKFQPWGSSGGSYMGPIVTAGYTVVNP